MGERGLPQAAGKAPAEQALPTKGPAKPSKKPADASSNRVIKAGWAGCCSAWLTCPLPSIFADAPTTAGQCSAEHAVQQSRSAAGADYPRADVLRSQVNGALLDMTGFHTLRNEFEPEHDNAAENSMAELEFREDDTEVCQQAPADGLLSSSLSCEHTGRCPTSKSSGCCSGC